MSYSQEVYDMTNLAIELVDVDAAMKAASARFAKTKSDEDLKDFEDQTKEWGRIFSEMEELAERLKEGGDL